MCLEILLLSVLINLSATTDFCSLYIEYISVLFIFKKSVKELLSTYILFSFLPCEIIFWKALTVLVPLLFFKVITHAYLLKISIVHNEWWINIFFLEFCIISTFYNKHCHCYLFPLFLLLFKKRWCLWYA